MNTTHRANSGVIQKAHIGVVSKSKGAVVQDNWFSHSARLPL